MIQNNFAAMVRGFCINLTGNPYFVISRDDNIELSQNVLNINLDLCVNEKAAANVIRNTYNEWKIKSAYLTKNDDVLLPSCAALSSDGLIKNTLWIDNNFDGAQKRFKEKNTSPIIDTFTKKTNIVNPEERSSVVKNKIAVVTGGAQGIGGEIAENLAAAGAFVFIADLNIGGAENLAQKINERENRTAAAALEVNVSSEESAEKMFNNIAHTAGGLDICISNAGVLKAGSVLEQELADFKFVTDINYTGFFVISKFAGRLLRAQHLTSPDWMTDIIQINSKSGLEGSNKNGAYAGGKFGSLGLAASFAMELIEYGIKVNAVCPGNFLDGPLWSDPDKGLFVQYLKNGKVPGAKTIKDVRAFYESKVPMQRGCAGKDLIRAIYYIIEQEYETGQAVPVTGGQVMLH